MGVTVKLGVGTEGARIVAGDEKICGGAEGRIAGEGAARICGVPRPGVGTALIPLGAAAIGVRGAAA